MQVGHRAFWLDDLGFPKIKQTAVMEEENIYLKKYISKYH